MEIAGLAQGFASVVLFERMTQAPVLRALQTYLSLCQTSSDLSLRTAAYSRFVSALYRAQADADLGKYLQHELEEDDNVYVRQKAAGKNVPAVMQAALEQELSFFSSLTTLTCAQLQEAGTLDSTNAARFDNTQTDLRSFYHELMSQVKTKGFGMFAHCRMFQIDGEGKLVAVPVCDPVTLPELVGYEAQRKEVWDNTVALLDGLPAANVLLCGDAGTGKSSTVKAIVNGLWQKGLRLIELRKEQLPLLPRVMEQIAHNPLKFIIFIDDLSFAQQDDGFGALKAMLEGSAAAKTPNAVIYATSNRRHIVRESFSARQGDDVHRNDTIEEMISLSARFGLSVLFVKPDKALYLHIVSQLAKANGLHCDENTLTTGAEAFALGRGGRSARAAKQYVDSLLRQERPTKEEETTTSC